MSPFPELKFENLILYFYILSLFYKLIHSIIYVSKSVGFEPYNKEFIFSHQTTNL